MSPKTANPPPYADFSNYEKRSPPPSYAQSRETQNIDGRQRSLPPSYEESEGFSLPKTKPIINELIERHFGPEPQYTTCESCHKQGLTIVKHKIGDKTNIAALLLFLSGLWCICLMPYYVKSLKDPVHHCRHCSHKLAERYD